VGSFHHISGDTEKNALQHFTSLRLKVRKVLQDKYMQKGKPMGLPFKIKNLFKIKYSLSTIASPLA
jgi:hypothetical protein